MVQNSIKEKIMKKTIFSVMAMIMCFCLSMTIVACGNNECKEVQLMGAGERIHDSYTFANTGVELKKTADNTYEITGTVAYLNDSAVKEEFNIAADVNHVVAIKLSNCSGNKTIKDEVEISVNGVRNYDAEHLNGDDYTYIILEAAQGVTTTISVKWNANMQAVNYTIKMADNLVLAAQNS